MAKRIKLSPRLREAYEWIKSPLEDYWGSECVKGSRPLPDSEGAESNNLVVPVNAEMPYLEGNTLVLSNWREINDDLQYRIGTNYVNLIEGGDNVMSPAQARALQRSCEKLAAAIRREGMN